MAHRGRHPRRRGRGDHLREKVVWRGNCLWLVLLACTGCAPSRYEVGHIESKSPSSHLSYRAQDLFRECDVTFFATEEALSTQLAVHRQAIAPFEGDSTKALVALESEGEESLSEVCARHEGGQKVTLSVRLQEKLIRSLQEGKRVKVRVAGYETVVTPHEFEQKFGELQSPSLWRYVRYPVSL